jgi:hypothetical protein
MAAFPWGEWCQHLESIEEGINEDIDEDVEAMGNSSFPFHTWERRGEGHEGNGSITLKESMKMWREWAMAPPLEGPIDEAFKEVEELPCRVTSTFTHSQFITDLKKVLPWRCIYNLKQTWKKC